MGGGGGVVPPDGQVLSFTRRKIPGRGRADPQETEGRMSHAVPVVAGRVDPEELVDQNNELEPEKQELDQEFPKKFLEDFISRIEPELTALGEKLKTPQDANSSGGAPVLMEGYSILFANVVDNSTDESAKDVAVKYNIVLTCGYNQHDEISHDYTTVLHDIFPTTNWKLRVKKVMDAERGMSRVEMGSSSAE